MNRMIKRLLAAVLITSMLLGANGISYAAEIADGDSIAGTEEVTQEAVDEEQVESPGDAEASEPADEESAEEVQTQEEAGEGQEADAQTVEEAGAEASEEENTAAEEEISEAASEEETVESEDEDAAVTEEAAAAEDAEAPENADAAAAELTAGEAAAAAAAAQAQEEVFTAGELVYHGADYDVTLAYDENAKIPATAELKVREIEKGTSEYESYLAGAEAAAGKGVAEARFFDITIVAAGTDGQQHEIQPQSQVRVNITYHKALEVAAEGEVQAMHFEDGTADAEVVNTDTNGGSEVSEIAFDAESFSVYGIVYTVDFTYGGYTYSMPGEGSIYLSELAQILGLYETDLDKAFSVDNVSNVTFTNYDLVKVEKQADGDWLLTSLAPFTSEETLTIEMNDGVKFIVDVTDAAIPSSSDLRDFITAVTIDAPVNEDGEYMVTPGTGYKISFSLAEGAGLQFDNTALTYSIPSGLNADGQEGTFSVTIEKDGQSYVIAGNTYKIENDTLTVTWNKNSGNYDILTAAGNVKFWLNFEGEFDENASEIVFSDGITKKIEIDNSSSVTASKSAAVDLANKKVNYTVAVTSTGNSTNVRIEDTITADTEGVLTLDPTSITAESSKTGEVGFVKNVEGNSFSCVIDSMQDGEVVTLTYSADIDTSKIPVDVNNNPTVVIGNNRVKVSNEYDPTPVEREVNTRIDYTPKIQKDGMVLNEDGETFDCRFTFNTDTAYSGANHQITDTLGEYLTLEGTTGARITIIDSEGNSTQQFLNWGESNPNFGTLNKAGGNDSFVYITPNIPGEYKYIVEYQVKVTGTEGLVEQITVSNTVQTDGDKSSTGTGTYTPATGELKLYKTADKIDYENKVVTWTVSIDVPETGLTEAYAALVDKLPQSSWIDEIGGSAWDTFVQGSETVTGLIGTESYTLDNDPANHKFTVKFINSSGEPGLDAGQKRVVTVTFKTAIDPNWLDAAKTRSWLANHVNNVELGTKTGSASVVIAGAGVTKTGELCGYRTVNGTRLPIYRFTLLLKNVTKDDNTIKDTFDRELLEPLYVDQLESTEGLTSDDKWYGWHTTNQYMSGVRSSSAVSYVDTSYGMDIITSADSMVHNSLTTTGFYEVTRIDYFLTVKDAAALKKIQDLAYADENNEYTFNNSAEWENTTGDVDVTYEYKGLKKELLTSDDDLTKTDENVTAQFRITLNPGGQTLNGGEPMTMTDTVTNLSVDVTTIQASPSAGVSWDMTGNTVTYIIPDSTQVIITYTATVIFDKIGDKGDTINSTFSNVAEMKGYNDKIEKTAHRKNNGGGGGAVYSIHLLKYKKGDMTKTLQGAEFALLDADKNPIQDKDGNNVTFKTDENGLITVEGDAEAFGWTLFADTDYYLKEIKAPEGFVLKNTYYKFIISENGLPDYDKNIYYSGDTMTCKNEKPGATLEVEKALGEDSIWPEGEIVIFTLQSVTEGAPMPESGGETVILSAPGKGTFGEIEYPVSDKEQTYVYKITESEGFGEGWTNSGDITATVVISPDDGSGNVTTTVTYSPENKTITNTYGDTTEIKVDKEWVNADGSSTWPEDVTVDIQLTADGVPVEGKTATLSADHPSHTFENLPKFTTGETGEPDPIVYSVEEGEVEFYSSSVSQLADGKITVTNTRKTGELEVTKTVVSSTASDKTKDFSFKVTLTPALSGTFGGTTFNENGVATFTLKDGETKKITGLPVGYSYKVEEETAAGFATTKTGDTGKISATKATAAFTNTKAEGGLIVSKSVESDLASDKTKEFEITVTLDDKTVNGTYGGMTFENGVATFTLKDKETKSATGLAKGIGYTVKEKDYDDFITTYEGQAGKIADVTAVAAVKNSRKKGSLEISKTVVSPVPAEKDADYTFTVTLKNGEQKVSGTYSGYSFDENGQATVTVKGGKSVTIEGLPAGTDYTVEEAEYANFNTEATGDTGTISETKATAAFKNTRKTGKVTISKTVVSPVPAEATKAFTFTIELSDTTVNGTFSDVKFTNGVAEVTVAGGSPKTIEGLPEGVTYTVTEAADNDFENTKKDGETGSITAAGATAAFTNTRKTGELEVTKTVVSSTASDETKDFSFTVTLSDKTISGEFGGMTFENGVAEFTLKHDGKMTATGLPVGCEYEVTEEAAAGFVTTKTGYTGTISAIKATAAFTNTKDEGGLIVSKSVESDLASDKTKEFEITVTLDDKTVNGTYGGMTFENGVATFTLKDKETKSATGLAKGIGYTVKEKDYDDFITTYEGQTGQIADATAVAAVKNSKKTGSLEISKTVVSPVPAEKDADYTFTVTLTNGDQKISGTYSGYSFDENGQATVTVKGEASVTIEGLPVGTNYKVEESKYDNFNTEATGDTGTISETKATAAFKNTRKTGKVTISKTVVSPVPAEETKEFTFTIELSDTTVNGTFSEVQFKNGVATVTVNGGSSKTIEGLPQEVNYTVTEAVDNDFTADKEKAEGTITAAGETAAFTNTRKTGELEVTKTVVSSTASDETKDFSFTVTLSDKTISGEFGGMTFENGVAKFTLKHDGKMTATGLPVGCEYEVTEEAATGFVTTKTGYTGTISAIKATAAFTNTKDEGGLIVSKSVVSDVTADKQKDFSFEVVLTDKSINGTYGQMTFENGVAKFTLKDGERKSATGLPDAIGYVVSESYEPASDFIIISDGATGNIVHNETNTAVFTNTRKTGNLKISKTVVSPVPAEKDADYTFTVTLTNGEQKISGKYSGYYFDENGQATVTVKGDASVTIKGLPVGTTYSVVESKYDNFDTESTGEAGDINDTKTSVAAFTNTRKTGSLEVTKTVANKNSTNTTSKFSFTVTLGDKTINGSFGDMTFNEGVAKFTLKDGEKAAAEGLPAGVSYVVEEANAEGFKTTKEEEAGEIKETIITASFTNTYLATGDVDLEVRKALEGRPLTDGQFGFELIGADGKVKQTKYCDSTGRVFFDRITYSQDDLQKNKEGFLEDTRIEYTVKEVIPADAADKGYTYDAEPKTITVTLHDNEDGTIKAEASPKPENVTFHNKYEAKGSIELNAGKILLGERALEKDKFEFELKDDKGKVLQRKKNDADGKVAFDAIEYTQDDIYEYDAATSQYKIKDKTSYEYKIQEVIPDDAVNADGTTYKEASEAEKKAGGFKKDGYTYDGTVHTITVELTDNGDGTIDAKVAGSEGEPGATGVVFTNAYDAAGTLKLDAEKTFKNGTLKGGEFTFELMDAAGKVLQSKKNDAAGNVSFDMITYKLADVAKAPFTYTVREVPGSRTDVKYDATVYTVTVSLEDNGDGTLKVTKKIDNGGELKFVNEQLNVETSVTIGGVKVLKGRTLKKDEFKFVLADENGKWLDTATNDAEGNFTFKPITYKLSDLNGEKTKVYSYSVWEVNGSESGITYDKTVYTVKVTVTDNGDGTMTAKADKAKSDIKFVNTTTEKKSKKTSSSKGSKTGDEAPLGVLFGGLGVGAIGLAVLLWNRKKKKDEE